MVRKWLSLLLVFWVACTAKIPAYNETVAVSENDAVWEVRLIRSYYADTQVGVELEYANRAGASFSIKPENLKLTDTEGGKWTAEGRFPYIPLLQPGETKKIKALFINVPVTEKPLFLHPFNDLVHQDVKFLVKDAGGAPLPGDHKDTHWDVAQ